MALPSRIWLSESCGQKKIMWKFSDRWMRLEACDMVILRKNYPVGAGDTLPISPSEGALRNGMQKFAQH